MWKGLVTAGGLGIVVGVGVAWLLIDREAAVSESASPVVPPVQVDALPTVQLDDQESQRGPARTLADIATIADDFERNAALYELVADADAAGVEELIGQVHALPSTPHRQDIARILYIRFAAVDPVAAADHVTQADHRPSWVEAVYRAWAHTDVDAAVAHAATLDRATRTYAMRAFFELDLPSWQRETIAKRMQGETMLAAIQTSEDLRRDEEDYDSVWQSALGVADAQLRLQRLATVANRWSQKDPVSAMAAAASIENPQLALSIQGIVFRNWATEDAWAATTWLADQEQSVNVQSLTYVLMGALTQQGIAHAISSLQTMPQSLRRHAEQGLIMGLQMPTRSMDRADVDTLVEWYETLGPASKRRLSGTLAMGLANHDPDVALDWVFSLEGNVREEAMGGLMSRVAAADMARAKRMIGGIEDAELYVVAARAVATTEASRNPRSALEWVRTLPSESARIDVASAVFSSWAFADPDGATRELLNLPAGTLRDTASRQTAFGLQHQGRADLLEQLFDGTESTEARRHIGRLLYGYFTRTNPDEAKADRYREFVQR